MDSSSVNPQSAELLHLRIIHLQMGLAVQPNSVIIILGYCIVVTVRKHRRMGLTIDVRIDRITSPIIAFRKRDPVSLADSQHCSLDSWVISAAVHLQ